MSDAPNCKHCKVPMVLVDVEGEVHQKWRCLSEDHGRRMKTDE